MSQKSSNPSRANRHSKKKRKNLFPWTVSALLLSLQLWLLNMQALRIIGKQATGKELHFFFVPRCHLINRAKKDLFIFLLTGIFIYVLKDIFSENLQPSMPMNRMLIFLKKTAKWCKMEFWNGKEMGNGAPQFKFTKGSIVEWLFKLTKAKLIFQI